LSTISKFRVTLKEFFEGKIDVNEKVFILSRQQGCSELEIFKRASRVWNKPEEFAEEHYTKYIMTERLPWFVRHYVNQFLGDTNVR
jgi:hypothetical protein